MRELRRDYLGTISRAASEVGGLARITAGPPGWRVTFYSVSSPELAAEKGIRNTDWVRVRTPRAEIRAKALVTRRVRPFRLGGKVVHQVGMPWHWGWEGLVTGDVVNTLSAMVGDPNVSIHEGKAFVCNVEKA